MVSMVGKWAIDQYISILFFRLSIFSRKSLAKNRTRNTMHCGFPFISFSIPPEAPMSRQLFVCRLPASDLPLYVRHLQSLPPEDLVAMHLEKTYGNVSLHAEEALRHFESQGDWFYGAFDWRNTPIGFLHAKDRDGFDTVELTVSVLPEYRKMGIGSALLDKAMLHARNIGRKSLSLHFQPENDGVWLLAKNAGMFVRHGNPHCSARAELVPCDPCSHMLEAGMEMAQRNLRQYVTTMFRPLNQWLSWQERLAP